MNASAHTLVNDELGSKASLASVYPDLTDHYSVTSRIRSFDPNTKMIAGGIFLIVVILVIVLLHTIIKNNMDKKQQTS